MLTAGSGLWRSSAAEVQTAVEGVQAPYQAVLADIADVPDEEKLEFRPDPDETEEEGAEADIQKWTSTLWNEVAQIDELAREAKQKEEKQYFEVTVPDVVLQHPMIAPHDIEEAFRAPLAPDAEIKVTIGPLVAGIAEDMAESRATRLAAIYTRELLRIFDVDCECAATTWFG